MIFPSSFTKQKLASILLVLTSFLLQRVHCLSCDEFQTQIDNLGSADSLVRYLSIRIKRQSDVEDLFVCLGQNTTHRRPTDIIKSFTDTNYATRNFIYGNGYASAYISRSIPFWNMIQKMIIRIAWSGKILKIDPSNDSVSLYNLMPIFRSMMFYADVYTKAGVFDGLDSIILDYRKDTNRLISKVRDEIREVKYRGIQSGIYLGQAYIYSGSVEDIFTDAWDDKNNFATNVNFLMDFRESNQANIPSWALDDYMM